MTGPKEMILGGIVPLVVAAVAFAIVWFASRRAGAAWPVGVIVGYLTGTVALDAGTVGLGPAFQTLFSPHAAHEWTWALPIAAAVPAIVAALLGERRAWRWAVAAPLAIATPLWLMWGGKYLPSAEVRATGFAKDAWSVGDAVLVIGVVALAILAAWRLWEGVDATEQPRTRGFLAAVALTIAAAVAGLSGSFVYAQVIGVLAASVGGCFIAAAICRVNAGPEAAAGPILLLVGSLLMLAAHYSQLQPIHAAGLWFAITFASAGWPLSLLGSNRGRIALRCAMCLLPLVAVAGHAGYKFAESQRQLQEEQQEEAESNPYMNL